MAFYKSIAQWYDYIFPASPPQLEFTGQQLITIQNKQILDVGCGTGNLSFLLAQSGAKVKGVDLDKDMIKIAQTKAIGCSNPLFLALDMLLLGYKFNNQTMDAVICYGNTLAHLLSPTDILSFLNQTASILKPGGTLLIQIINYDYILDQGLDKLPTIENSNIKFERNYQFREQDEMINFKTNLTVKSTHEYISNSVPLNPIRKNSLLIMLEEAGFKHIELFGAFDGTPLKERSLQMIIKALKK